RSAFADRRVGGPRRPVWREGGGRGAAPSQRPGARERDLRRARHPLRSSAVRSAARARTVARRRSARALGARARAGAKRDRRAGGRTRRRRMLTLPAFEWRSPSALHEALALLAEDPQGSLPVAGGTDAVP